MEIKIDVDGKPFEGHCIEQPQRARGTRWRAYVAFDGRSVTAQGSSPQGAIEELRQMLQILLD